MGRTVPMRAAALGLAWIGTAVLHALGVPETLIGALIACTVGFHHYDTQRPSGYRFDKAPPEQAPEAP
jgi:hypothetical protein